jgi:hypothetical protein
VADTDADGSHELEKTMPSAYVSKARVTVVSTNAMVPSAIVKSDATSATTSAIGWETRRVANFFMTAALQAGLPTKVWGTLEWLYRECAVAVSTLAGNRGCPTVYVAGCRGTTMARMGCPPPPDRADHHSLAMATLFSFLFPSHRAVCVLYSTG